MRESSLMRRMRMLGLAVVAVLALAGIVASGASAAPEFKGCVKTETKNTGRYTDKLCATESPTSNGAYELVPSIGKGKGFKAQGGATTLHVIVPSHCCVTPLENGHVHVRCTAVKGKGSLGLPNLIKEAVIEFKGCKIGTMRCHSAGKKGAIVTNSLAGEMIDIEGGSGVGSLLEAEAGPTAPLATFTCGPIITTLLGSVIAEQTGDVGVISKESQDHFVVGSGLGEIEGESANADKAPVKYTPLVNLPTYKTGGAAGEHFLLAELHEEGGGERSYPSGLEATVSEKGEALMLVP